MNVKDCAILLIFKFCSAKSMETLRNKIPTKSKCCMKSLSMGILLPKLATIVCVITRPIVCALGVESIDVTSVNVDIVSLCLNNLCQILMLHLMLMFSFRWKEK